MALLHAISIFCEVYDDEVPAEQLLKDLQQVEYRALLYLTFLTCDLHMAHLGIWYVKVKRTFLWNVVVHHRTFYR